ncbi:MAG: GTP 3',8-cyclase MoaA, partial [Thermoplasmata archaeon]
NAGLDRVNISYDAFNPTTYKNITNKNFYHEVRKGVEAAVDAGLNPVKLNMVVLKNINDSDIPHAIEFASDVGAILQLIEFESSKEGTRDQIFKKYHHSLNKLETELEKRAQKIVQRNMHRRKKYIVPSENNGKAEVEIVRGMHNSLFCKNCTRLRVTSNGELKPCLLRSDNHINIINPIREGKGDDELITYFQSAIFLKEPYWGV